MRKNFWYTPFDWRLFFLPLVSVAVITYAFTRKGIPELDRASLVHELSEGAGLSYEWKYFDELGWPAAEAQKRLIQIISEGKIMTRYDRRPSFAAFAIADVRSPELQLDMMVLRIPGNGGYQIEIQSKGKLYGNLTVRWLVQDARRTK